MVESRRRGLTISVPMELSTREVVELRLVRGSATSLGLICYAGNPVCTYYVQYVQGYVQGYSQK